MNTPDVNRLGYHSVHLPRITDTPAQRWTDGRSAALVHDVLALHLPPEFKPCDVLYADLPWQSGFAEYNERAGVDDRRTYRDFMTKVSGMVRRQSRPMVLVTGKHALKLLPEPTQVAPVRMPVANRQAAVAVIYRTKLDPTWIGTAGLLDALAQRFERVGDFCCGYGWSAKAFAKRGKAFTASDYNAECVGYIATHAPDWRPVK